MSFSPDSDKLACGTTNDVRIYDLSNNSLIFGAVYRQQRVYSFLWSPCGFKLFSGSHDGTIFWWKYEMGKLNGYP